ncbi:mucin-2-like isoform X2 [Solea solea]|uniref:mucin-2-like isoform X2 n=1 Tax=Solea solea TaxID=90069 RepID=UPI00272A9595|nr:mucin-2-like isoform X2 [Solea solea]
MALSQVQCLDDNHVNPRTHESKPEFLYSEDQRLAVEALLCDGREAFFKYLEDRGLRGFLSDPELETLAGAVEPRDPDTELLPQNAEEGVCESRLSLQYWPDLSDTSVPQMDLGWPDTKSYRGVTRATVYTQPPLDGQAHIKEIVRRTIAQAQKVIAVVMDVFTDVDIFRDLLDAGFKRKVSVYILLERTRLPHFLSMCQRANMHAGYLKHLRVRCAEGAEFCSRSCAKVKGQLGHRFMFIDGDKAVSGSYSFTWMASRLDRNLITVVTGQAVDGFDQLFRILYLTSSFVDLRQVTTESEPEPEPAPLPAAVAPPSAADVRKLYNPKYALVAAGNLITSTAKNSTKEPKDDKNADVLDGKKMRRGKDTIQEAPPLHPGLINLEKACLISYLPTWPEPDPPSDVIGFINIRDASKPNQVHLQRSEMFETSQAIRFSSPFSTPKEAPLEVAQHKHENMNKPQSTQNETKAAEPVVDSNHPVEHSAEPSGVKTKEDDAPEQSLATSVHNPEPAKDTSKTLNTENELHLNTTTKQNPNGQNSTTSHVCEHSLSQSSSNSSTPSASSSSHTTPTVTTSSPKLLSPSGSIPEKETETSLNTRSSESHTQTETEVTQIDSRTRALPMRPHSSPEMTLNIQTVHSHMHTSSASPVQPQSVSPPSLSEKDSTELSRTDISDGTSVPSISCSTPVPPLISSTTLDPPVPASSAASTLTMIAPIPKPRTVQLVIRNDGASEGQKLPEVSVVRRPESRDSTVPLVVRRETDAVNVLQTHPEKEPETLAQVQVSAEVKPGALKDTASAGNPKGTTHPHQNVTSQETKDDERVNTAVPLSPAAPKPQGQSDVLTVDAPKAHSENNQEVITKGEVKNNSLMSSDFKTPSKTDMDSVATVQTGAKALDKTLLGCGFTKEPNENSEAVMRRKTYLARAHEPQIISYCEVNSPVDISARTNPRTSNDSGSHADDEPNVEEHNRHDGVATQGSQKIPKAQGRSYTPERPRRLNLVNTHMSELHSPTTEKPPQPPSPLVRTPTPDDFIPRTPTSGSRSHTPDPRNHTLDFRTPTSDMSDGYVSPREGSTLSTTSEEYYECIDSPTHDPVFHQIDYLFHGTTVDCDCFVCTNASPLHINDNSHASEARKSLSSSSQEKLEMGSTEMKAKRQEDAKGIVADLTQEIERIGGNDRKTLTDHFIEAKDLTEISGNNNNTQPQVAKGKQSAAPRVDGGVSPREIMNKASNAKRTLAGDLMPEKCSTDRGKPDKEKLVDEAAVRPSSVERRVQSSRDTQGQKALSIHTIRPD